MKSIDCRFFTGYKPCKPGKICAGCKERQPLGHKILIINLDALGNVLMTTALLPALHRKYCPCTIHWLTRSNAMPLLYNNPYIHKSFALEPLNVLVLQQIQYHTIINVDKTVLAGSLLNIMKGYKKLGFGLNENGHIIPASTQAIENYELGLNDRKKFVENTRTGQQILAQTAMVPYQRDPYILEFTAQEKDACNSLRKKMRLVPGLTVVGLNTGCSELYPNKCLTTNQQIRLIKMLKKAFPKIHILLLGGPEDKKRNAEIKRKCRNLVAETPTNQGLRTGLICINLCDVVISGDSLGMHIAIALKKFVIAWFGLSCSAEIDLYDRGIKIVSPVPCSPCWKSRCDKSKVFCRDDLELGLFVKALAVYFKGKT